MSSVAELSREALMLSASDRILLAQQIWDSLQPAADRNTTISEDEFIEELRRRDQELDRGTTQGIAHSDVIANARAALKCE